MAAIKTSSSTRLASATERTRNGLEDCIAAYGGTWLMTWRCSRFMEGMEWKPIWKTALGSSISSCCTHCFPTACNHALLKQRLCAIVMSTIQRHLSSIMCPSPAAEPDPSHLSTPSSSPAQPAGTCIPLLMRYRRPLSSHESYQQPRMRA